MARKMSRLLIVLLGLLLVVCVVLGVGGVALPRMSFPTTEGEIRLQGLDGPVDVIRDAYGIPHIYASTQHDLFFAQGYVQAQDRFWQMDVARHTGPGRLSEMFGDATISTDKFLRTLQFERLAWVEYEQADPDSRQILDAFSEGVNAYLADHQGSSLSLEYSVLSAINPSYQAAEWQPVNTLTWAKMMAWDLGGNMGSEIQKAVLLKTLPPERVDELYLPYPEDHPVIVPGFEPQSGQTEPADPLAAYTSLPADLTPALLRLAGQVDAVDRLLGLPGGSLRDGIGSNDWVIAGARTSTGMPILADDPHLGVQMPSIWYEIGLHCTQKSPSCPYDVVGFAFSSSPGVIIGHNDRIAWGVTNTGPDVQDLFIEKINPDNPNQYEFEGRWVDMDVYPEVIEVAGGEPISLTVRFTHHGPLLGEVYGPLETIGERAALELPEGVGPFEIALRWTAIEPATIYTAILKIDRAQNWDEFRDALRSFNVPSQNFVYADVDGNIGYQMPGSVPVRRAGEGRLPVPGWTGEYEWEGYIPFDELPTSFNPPQGYIATANNAVVGPDYPYTISTNFDAGYRAARIVEMIENAPGPIDLAYVQQMHGDNKNLNAETLVPLVQALDLREDPGLVQAQELLATWDYQQHMDSPAAALFEVFWKNLLAETFHDDLPERYWPGGNSSWFEVVRRISQNPGSAWWDDLETTEVETRDEILARSFALAVSELKELQGISPEKWSWGELHTVTFVEGTLGGTPVIGNLFNRGPYPTSGGASIVNATGWSATNPYQVRSLPSMRMIVDLSNLQNSVSVNTTGQSGHAYHPHYVDQVDLWRTIQYHPMQWDAQAVDAAAEGHLRLVP